MFVCYLIATPNSWVNKILVHKGQWHVEVGGLREYVVGLLECVDY
jgi:hypothetical protein